MDEQATQVLVAALRDAHQHLAITAGMLAWDKANPSGEMPPINSRHLRFCVGPERFRFVGLVHLVLIPAILNASETLLNA